MGSGEEDKGLESLWKELGDIAGDVDLTSTSSAPKNDTVDLSSFPTEMNCSQVFDQLLKCYSIGGQVRHYYRYGELSKCVDKRSKLKFCMGTKMKSEDDRKRAISRWYMQRLAEQKANAQNSEQIWTARTEPLRRPFREDSAKVFEEGQN